MPSAALPADTAVDRRVEAIAPTTPAGSAGTAAAAATACRKHLRYAADVIRNMFWARSYDSFIERPDIVEDDYYRFLNQPRGY
jgi:hypothetical protein